MDFSSHHLREQVEKILVSHGKKECFEHLDDEADSMGLHKIHSFWQYHLNKARELANLLKDPKSYDAERFKARGLVAELLCSGVWSDEMWIELLRGETLAVNGVEYWKDLERRLKWEKKQFPMDDWSLILG